jgi:phosphoenolpyruvate-protein phosphotransferase (PTS system enzyme I)
LHKEKIHRGIAASQGISIGKAYLYMRKQVNINTMKISDAEVKAEIELLKNSIDVSLKELDKIYGISVERIGEKNSKIFEAQIEIIKDNIFLDTVLNRIESENRSAGFVFNDEIEKLGQIFLRSDNHYMHERYADLIDVKNRVIRNMKRDKLVSKVEEDAIIFAHELTPADTILFSRRKVRGYATDTGGITSHTAIISRALRVPSVVGLKMISKQIETGDLVIIDGYEGLIISHPTDETITVYRNKQKEYLNHEMLLVNVIKKPCETLDKKRVELTANIEFIEETEFLQNCGDCGIGLYRTEHLYMEKGDFPSTGEQIEDYTHISNITFPKKVTIRTYDLGGDKIYKDNNYKEVNPYLGWRGIRMCLDKTDIFKSQLEALLISSTKKNIKIMLPMITSVDEVRQTKVLLKEVKKGLDERGVYYDKNIPLGIMIEVPSAVLIAEELAREVDFFSIGTNDLIQYTLAVDRGNEFISALYQQFHPALIRSLQKIVDAGHNNKIKVSICGEMASVPYAVPVLIGLGMDELSVLPSMFSEIKQIVRATKYTDAKVLVDELLTFPAETQIKNKVVQFFETKIKLQII